MKGSKFKAAVRRAVKGWVLALAIVLAGATLVASVFECRIVEDYDDMADVRVGFPIPFLAINFQRYTPVYYPEDFCGPGSPWEDPQRVLFMQLAVSSALLVLFYYGLVELLRWSSMRLRSSR